MSVIDQLWLRQENQEILSQSELHSETLPQDKKKI